MIIGYCRVSTKEQNPERQRLKFVQLGIPERLVSVFAGFMLAEDPMIKVMGFALTFGIFFDAFVVRLFIVPGVMALLGKSAWYLPKWLDRLLPNLDVEGEEVMKIVEAKLEKAS